MRLSTLPLEVLALMTLACVICQSPALGADFVPEEVFAGRSVGTGELKLLFGRRRPFTVESRGGLQADGTLALHQTIRFEDRPVQTRSWVMHRTGPATYSATLSDAAGPVSIHVAGPRMTLRYPLKRWGLVMHQTLDLARDGRTIANRGRISLLGMPLGHLRETIELGR